MNYVGAAALGQAQQRTSSTGETGGLGDGLDQGRQRMSAEMPVNTFIAPHIAVGSRAADLVGREVARLGVQRVLAIAHRSDFHAFICEGKVNNFLDGNRIVGE